MALTDHSTDAPIWRDPRAIALLCAATCTVMAAATISPALTGLRARFGSDGHADLIIRLLVPAPSLAVVLAAPICGIVADQWGKRRMLLGGIGLFVLAGCLGLALDHLPTLLASRLVLGVALAMIMTAQSALTGDYFSGAALHRLTGAQASARNLGGFVFISLAGALASLDPRLPFAVYALPLLYLPLMWRAITEPPRSLPDPGAPADPTGPNPRILLLALGQMVVTMAFFVMPTQLPFYLEHRGHDAPAMTGAVLAALMLAGGGAALIYPALRARLGDAGNWALGFGLMAAGFALLILGADPALFLAGGAAVGAGYALSIPGFAALALSISAPGQRGRTGAWLTGSVFLGQFLSPLISLPAIAHWGWTAAGLGLAGALTATSVIALSRARRRACG